MTIFTILQEIADKMCTEFCKYNVQIVALDDDDDDDAVEEIIKKYCDICPLNKIM